MKTKRSTVLLSWGRVSYLEWAPDDATTAPVVVLLHGGGLDSAELSWGQLGPLLAEAGYRVVAPDHPGYGHTPPAPWAATQERLVGYVREFVDALGLQNYIIGGLSLGGGMTLGHLLERPNAARGAILLGSYGLMDCQFTGWSARPLHFLTWVLLRTGILGRVMRAYGRKRQWLDSSVRSLIRNPQQRTPELLDQIMEAAASGGALAAFEQWQRDQFLWNRLRTNYSDHLASVQCPALLVHGTHDSGVPLQYVQAATKRMPAAKLVVIPEAGHWVQRDRPDLVAPAIIDFLRTVN